MISLGSLYLVSVSFGADSRLSQEGDEGAGRFCCCTAADPSFVSKLGAPALPMLLQLNFHTPCITSTPPWAP